MSSDIDPSKPFETLLSYSETFHPEVPFDILDDLKEGLSVPEEDLPSEARTFKRELRQVLSDRDGAGLDDREVWDRVHHGDGSLFRFLRRMWVECFPDEPIPGDPLRPFDAVLTIGYLYYDNASDPDDNPGHPERLKEQLARRPTAQGAVLRALKPDLARIIAGITEGMDSRELARTVAGVPRDPDQPGIARALWFDLFPDDPIPGEEHLGPAGTRNDLWPWRRLGQT